MFNNSYSHLGFGLPAPSPHQQQCACRHSVPASPHFPLNCGTGAQTCQCSNQSFNFASATTIDPAYAARQRLVLAMQEQQVARKAYADLVAERELARLEAAAASPSAGSVSFDNFDSAYGSALFQPHRVAPVHHHHQHHLASQQRVLAERELRRQQELEADRMLNVAAAHQAKLQQVREQKLKELREKKLAEAFEQLLNSRRQQEADNQRRQQVEQQQRRLQALAEEQRKAVLKQREAARKQREEEDSVSQAIALAVALAQQFLPEEPKQSPVATEPVKKRVHFEPVRPAVAPTQKASTSASPSVTPAPVASTSTPVRVQVRSDTKGKASSHVRVNSVTSPSTETTPADAIAALTLLSSDIDSYLAPSHVWHSDAHRRHTLNQVLEQIDAVESGGAEAVREVRRALVRRVERAIEGLRDEEPRKEKGIQIREPVVESASAPVAVATTTADVVADPELAGYDVPDFMEASSTPSETPATSSTVDTAFVPEWSSVDPAAPAPVVVAPPVSFEDDSELGPTPSSVDSAETSTSSENAPQLVLGEPEFAQPLVSVESSTEAIKGDSHPTPLDVVAGTALEEQDAPQDVPADVAAKTHDRDGLSDWESGSAKAASDAEDSFDLV